jgi:putative endonuclease
MKKEEPLETEATAERRSRYRRGLSSELIAAAFLTAKGYRVVARRFRASAGEIDLIAVRRGLVAFVEVKRRRDSIAAEAAITPLQRRRIHRAADVFVTRYASYREYERRFDVVFVLPWRWPRHIEGGL